MKNKSSAPSTSKRSMPAGPARKFRDDQAKLDRAARLGDDGPKTARFAPSKSPRPMPAGPARKFRDDQAKLDRSARLGDSGPMNAGSAFRVNKGYKSGGMVKGGSGCKTY